MPCNPGDIHRSALAVKISTYVSIIHYQILPCDRLVLTQEQYALNNIINTHTSSVQHSVKVQTLAHLCAGDQPRRHTVEPHVFGAQFMAHGPGEAL